ncbi:MAG: hypothetical protein WDZ30_03375, partial [Cellvibrionaceae bacterium]
MTFYSASSAAEGEHFVDDPAAKKYALIIVGAAVDEQRANEFGGWGLALRESLHEDYGYAPHNVRMLLGSTAGNDFNVDGSSRVKSIHDTFETLALRIESGDQLTVFLIGHGSGSGTSAKFNIVGPDLAGAELGALLNYIKTQNIIAVNTTSA